MSVAFSNLSWWLWSGKKREAKLQNGSFSNESNVFELDVLKFPVIGGGGGNALGSNSRRVHKKWGGQEQGKIDKEFDVVVVPSDGGCFSDSESDDSDWSIGWSEPHAPDFLRKDEIEGGFGVLVPCYGRGHGGKRRGGKNRGNKIGNFPDYSSESRKYMEVERWLSSLDGTAQVAIS